MTERSVILGQAGKSLPDMYDVRGSQVDIEELDAHVIAAVHEMGAVINSERMGSSVVLLDDDAVLQSADVLATVALDAGITRILNCFVYTDVAGRLSDVSVWLQNAAGTREVPLFVWETTVDDELPIRLNNDGAIGGFIAYRPTSFYPSLPMLAFGAGQRAQMPTLVMRGQTPGFGAGEVDIHAVVQIVSADVTGTGTGAPSNIGLPLASW